MSITFPETFQHSFRSETAVSDGGQSAKLHSYKFISNVDSQPPGSSPPTDIATTSSAKDEALKLLNILRGNERYGPSTGGIAAARYLHDKIVTGDMKDKYGKPINADDVYEAMDHFIASGFASADEKSDIQGTYALIYDESPIGVIPDPFTLYAQGDLDAAFHIVKTLSGDDTANLFLYQADHGTDASKAAAQGLLNELAQQEPELTANIMLSMVYDKDDGSFKNTAAYLDALPKDVSGKVVAEMYNQVDQFDPDPYSQTLDNLLMNVTFEKLANSESQEATYLLMYMNPEDLNRLYARMSAVATAKDSPELQQQIDNLFGS
ncbi:MAG: hypothetical protein AAFZ92_07645 [Pseudomonadota bacterium]